MKTTLLCARNAVFAAFAAHVSFGFFLMLTVPMSPISVAQETKAATKADPVIPVTVPLIEGPSEAEPGDILHLHAKGATEKDWQATVLIAGALTTVDLKFCDAGQTIALRTPPQRVVYVVYVSVGDATARRSEQKIVTVKGVGPKPPVTPVDPDNPPPPEVDPLPPGLNGLSRLARDWAKELPPEAWPSARPLAKSYRAIDTAIAAGTLSTTEEITAALKESNNAALGSNVNLWKPWGIAYTAKMAELYKTGAVKNKQQWREALISVALGLEAVEESK